MNIGDLTINEAKSKLKELEELQSLFGVEKKNITINDGPYEIGKSYLVRTVTMAVVGRLKGVFEKELVFESASWISDTGRFSDALKSGLEYQESSEIEPFINDVIIGRLSIVDCVEYLHELPSVQK